MRKIYRKLTAEQKARGVIFSSCLSENTQEGDNVIEVVNTEYHPDEIIARLLNDKFFDTSHYKHNIVRRGD